MSLLLVYMTKNCPACIKLLESNFFDELYSNLDQLGIGYRVINFDNWVTQTVKDDPRFDFHKKIMRFVPLFAMVPIDQYFDHKNVSADELMESAEVFNGIIRNGTVDMKESKLQLPYRDILDFIKCYDPKSKSKLEPKSVPDLIPLSILLFATMSMIKVG